MRDQIRDQTEELRNQKLKSQKTLKFLIKLIRQCEKAANQLETVSITIDDSTISE